MYVCGGVLVFTCWIVGWHAGKFQRDLLNAEYDLDLWREKFAGPQWDFSLLDMNGGAGWDLASKLVCKRNARRRGRLSAQEILLHPFMLFA